MTRGTYWLSLDIDGKNSADRQNAFFVVVVENTQEIVDEFDMAFDLTAATQYNIRNVFGVKILNNVG